MTDLADYPLAVLVFSLVVLWLATLGGDFLRRRRSPLEDGERYDLGIIQAATMTLLALIIGFTFAMAISRYDQRKNCEAVEANAIGTEYTRIGFLGDADAVRIRQLLRDYLDQRVLFYESRDEHELSRINADTNRLQSDLWSSLEAAARTRPTPLVALTANGMNDVLDSQGYTEAIWQNRVPRAAQLLLMITAAGCSLMIGYGTHRANRILFLIFPLAVSIAFFLIADIDSPRRGMVHVVPENLISVSQSLQAK